MAKKKEEVEAPTPSWDDFSADNLINLEEEEVDEKDENEEEEVEEDDKGKEKPKPKKKVKAEEEEDETEEESEEEVEEDEKDSKKKGTKSKKEEVESEEEETEETEDEKEEEEENTDPLKFFEEVEKLTGHEVDVDYGEIDPLSPQGVAVREKAVREAAIDSFLEEIEAKFPAAYKALQYANDGGDVAELFKTTSSRDYSKVTLDEKDKPLAQEILREYYKSRGVKTESKLARLIQDAEDSTEGLISEAKSALEELKSEQAEAEETKLATQKAQADEQKKRDNVMVTALDEVLESGKLGNFKLAGRQEAAQFRSHILESIRRTGDGKYEFITPIDSTNLEKLLQYRYFQFKKGDLSKLIQIKASSEQAKKLSLRMKAETSTKKKGTGAETDKNQSTSLKDFDVN